MWLFHLTPTPTPFPGKQHSCAQYIHAWTSLIRLIPISQLVSVPQGCQRRCRCQAMTLLTIWGELLFFLYCNTYIYVGSPNREGSHDRGAVPCGVLDVTMLRSLTSCWYCVGRTRTATGRQSNIGQGGRLLPRTFKDFDLSEPACVSAESETERCFTVAISDSVGERVHATVQRRLEFHASY